VNISDPSLKIRRVDLPKVPDAELPEIIKWGMKDVVGGEVDHYVFRHQVLPPDPARTEQPYLIFAIMREAIKAKMDFLSQLGIPQPTIVEPNVSALGIVMRHSYGLGPDDHCVVVDMGCTASLYAVVGSEGLFFSRALGNISGDGLTKQLSRMVGVDEPAAEQFKVAYPSEKIPEEHTAKVKEVIDNFFTSVVVEVQRSIDAYVAQFPGKPVAKIYFTGGGCQLPGFVQRVSGTLNIPAEILEPFQKIDLGRFRMDALAPQKVYYALACGLALE
jgi:Tfp pilus assembly PilM family ATPase